MDGNTALGDVIAIIIRDFGEDALQKPQFVLSVLMDLAPAMKKEKEILRHFLQYGGTGKILAVKHAPHKEQEDCLNRLVQDLEDAYGLSRKAAQYVCGEFFRGVTGRKWVFPAPETVSTTNTDVGTTNVNRHSTATNVNGQNTQANGKNRNTTGGAANMGSGAANAAATAGAPKKAPWAAIAAVMVVLICIFVLPGLLSGRETPQTAPPAQSGQVVQKPANAGQTTQKPADTHVHSWKNATCTDPKTCTSCGQTSGSALGHQWNEATYDTPKTCRVCQATEGKKLGPDPVYINELDYDDKYGKIWTMSNSTPGYYVHTDVNDPEDYKDMNTPGHTTGPVYDYLGNAYTYGIHVDGDEYAAYYITYDIGGRYRTFSGVCCMSPEMDGDSRASTCTKYFEVYGDGVLLFRSLDFSQGSSPQKFSIDISNVHKLMIRYPKTSGPSRIATIFDGKLS